jgi:hypothetical protein
LYLVTALPVRKSVYDCIGGARGDLKTGARAKKCSDFVSKIIIRINKPIIK